MIWLYYLIRPDFKIIFSRADIDAFVQEKLIQAMITKDTDIPIQVHQLKHISTRENEQSVLLENLPNPNLWVFVYLLAGSGPLLEVVGVNLVANNEEIVAMQIHQLTWLPFDQFNHGLYDQFR